MKIKLTEKQIKLIIQESIDYEYLNKQQMLKENKNFIYNDSDYERYLSLEKEIVNKLNEFTLYPEKDKYFASTWYRRSHENDKDLIFSEMNFPNESNLKIKRKPFDRVEKERFTNLINEIINNYGITSVKIIFNDKNRGIILKNFKDKKIKKVKKGRKNFEYPINGKKVKFLITDRDIVPFVGVKSLHNIFNNNKSLNIDGTYNIVSYLSSHLNRYIKIDDDIFNLNDVENAYVKFFQDTNDIETNDNVGTKDIMFKTYILNDLKTYNDKTDLLDLFDMLETINFDFVFYDSTKSLSGEHYVRKLK